MRQFSKREASLPFKLNWPSSENFWDFSGPLSFAVVDWDLDGDLDIIIKPGRDSDVKYFECVKNYASGEPKFQQVSDPLPGVLFSNYGLDIAVGDWDGDGDADVVERGDDGSLRYFENAGPNSQLMMQERFGFENPFDGFDVGAVRKDPANTPHTMRCPVFVDWDADGDLDLVVADRKNGELRFFEHLQNGSVAELQGTNNPLAIGASGQPFFVDWDRDGDIDFFVETVEPNDAGYGPLEFHTKLDYFERISPGQIVQRWKLDNPLHKESFNSYAAAITDFSDDGFPDVLRIPASQVLPKYNGQTITLQTDVQEPGTSLGMWSGFPLAGVGVGDHAAPSLIDWDKDGDLDVILGNGDGTLRYFEHLSADLLEERVGEENPFRGVNVGSRAAPAAIDWDGDGDIDILVGAGDGTVHFYEQQPGGKFIDKTTGAGFPIFEGSKYVSVPSTAPLPVDWDGDGDVDLVLGLWSQYSPLGCQGCNDHFEPRMMYYERIDAKTLKNLTSSSFSSIRGTFPSLVDWDGDGKLDLVYSDVEGQLGFAKHNPATGKFDDAVESPFRNMSISVSGPVRGPCAASAFADWDGDGDQDLLVGAGDGTVALYMKDFCEQPMPCDFRGSCQSVTGQCKCFEGYSSPSCTSCAGDFYTKRRAYPPRCVSCPQTRSETCAGRGRCIDDISVLQNSRKNPISNTLALSVAGNGSCVCTEPVFGGVDDDDRTTCDEGHCPAGSEEERGAAFGHHAWCKQCPGGTYSVTGGQCEECPAGRAAGRGQGKGECSQCDPGRVSFPEQSFCTKCPDGSVPGGNHTVCVNCLPGKAALKGSSVCAPCRAGFQAGVGSAKCEICDEGTIPAEARDSCVPCPAGTMAKRGSYMCEKCMIGQYAERGSANCAWDFGLFSSIAVAGIVQTLMMAIILRYVRRRTKIADISQLGDKLVITTSQPHGFKMRSSFAPRVALKGTGHLFIDTKQGFNFRWRQLDPTRLEVFTLDMKPILEQVDASMGTARQTIVGDILNTGVHGPLVMLALFGLPMPWIALTLLAAWNTQVQDVMKSLIVAPMFFSLLAGLGLGFAAKLVDRSRRTPMEERVHIFRGKLLESNPDAKPRPRGMGRAISSQQLQDLLNFFRDFVRERNGYYLAANVIKPLTQAHQLSYAELCSHSAPQRYSYFCSHHWGTCFAHFVETIGHHARSVGGSRRWCSMTYWVCFLSNNQWNVAEELGNGDWKESSFYKALRSGRCKGTCMVLDTKAVPLTRSWCLFEVLQTYLLEQEVGYQNFNGLTWCTAEGVIGSDRHSCYDTSVALAHRLSTLSVADATASDPSDQQMIATLVEEEGGMATMNTFIRNNMMSTLDLVQKHFLRDMTVAQRALASSGTQDACCSFDAGAEVTEQTTLNSQESAKTACSSPGSDALPRLLMAPLSKR